MRPWRGRPQIRDLHSGSALRIEVGPLEVASRHEYGLACRSFRIFAGFPACPDPCASTGAARISEIESARTCLKAIEVLLCCFQQKSMIVDGSSVRSQPTVGATSHARRAGIHAPSNETLPSNPTATAIDNGSHGFNANNRFAAHFDAKTASAIRSPRRRRRGRSIPAAPCAPRCRGFAPSAIRIPISTRRFDTMYDITP